MTTAELISAGLTEGTLRVLVKRGVLTPLDHGVYARAELAAKLAGSGERGKRALRLASALATLGPQAVGSHHDAAIVHGLALLDRRPDQPVAVSRPPGAGGSRTGRPGVRIHTVALPAHQLTISNGVPVTSVARTVVDLARTIPFRSGVVVADSALHSGKTTAGQLDAVISACGQWPGIQRARRVVAFSDARSESPFESISRVAFRDGGLPDPELQVWVGGDIGRVGRADFLWREHATIAEADGAIKYADPERARAQLRRDQELRDAGFEVVHFTWRDLTVTPGRVVASIRAAFRRGDMLRTAEPPARLTG